MSTPVTTTLKIGSTLATVATVARGANRVRLQRAEYGIQGVESLDFTQEVAGSLQGTYSQGQWVTLALTDGTTTVTIFQGRIASTTTVNIALGVISVGYHCQGMRYLANQITTTSTANSTGRLVYNLPHTDPNWSQNLSGLSVGSILADYFAMHATQLTALGISQPPSSDLTPLTVVPNSTVVMTGRIFDMADSLMSDWGCGRYQLYIDPNTLQVRVVDTTALAASTLTFGTDPIELGGYTVDVANCYTQVVLRGGGKYSAMVCSLGAGTMADGWTNAQETAWTIDAFLYPSNSVLGAITSMTTSSVTAHAFSGPVTTWSADYWDGATIWVQYGFGSNFGGTTATTQYSEYSEVVSCTATTSGSATFTVDVPFSSIVYTSCEIRGAPTGESLVYRIYTIPNSVKTPEGLQLNLHLVQTLPGTVNWSPVDGVVTQATSPQAEVYYGGGCVAGAQQAMSDSIQVYPSPDGTTPGYVVTAHPTCQWGSSQSSLKAGTPDGKACDVKVLLPYSRGNLSVQSPSGGGYSGTAYTRFGWQQTLYRDYPDWLLAGQSISMQTLADNILQTLCNAVIDGQVTYYGAPLAMMTLGRSLNLTGGLATGSVLASMSCAIRSVVVEWPDPAGTYQVVRLHFNNQRKPYTGDSLYMHPLATRSASGGGYLSLTPDAAQQTQLYSQQQQAQGRAMSQYGARLGDDGRAEKFGESAGFTPEELDKAVADRHKQQQAGGMWDQAGQQASGMWDRAAPGLPAYGGEDAGSPTRRRGRPKPRLKPRTPTDTPIVGGLAAAANRDLYPATGERSEADEDRLVKRRERILRRHRPLPGEPHPAAVNLQQEPAVDRDGDSNADDRRWQEEREAQIAERRQHINSRRNNSRRKPRGGDSQNV